MNATPSGLARVAFHLRHIAGSVDRLLTYAEGSQLTAVQIAALSDESAPNAVTLQVLADLRTAFQLALKRVTALTGVDLEAPRSVGRRALPTTVGGLLVHVADHTQRHIGQAIITAKIIRAQRQTNAE
jgi:uncharacterized damage-inducible protein DinB